MKHSEVGPVAQGGATPATRVLVCEDEPLLRAWLRDELTRQGFEVVGTARDGEVAVELGTALQPEVALMDVAMPRRDGLSASQALLALPDPPIIVLLTAYGDDETIARALEIGVAGYLVKPIEAAQLKPAIALARQKAAETRDLRAQVGALQDSLETRKLMDRAKGILMRQLSLDEPGAHQALQRLASQKRLSIKETAARIVAAEGELKAQLAGAPSKGNPNKG